jgi:phage-related protein
MLNLPLALRLEKNKLVSTAPWLLLLTLTLPDASVVRLARNTEDVTFGGHLYSAFAFDLGEIRSGGDGKIQGVSLRVANPARAFAVYMDTYAGLVGCALTLVVVNADNLAEDHSELTLNWTVIASQVDEDWVTFTLGEENPLRRRYPLYSAMPANCSWIFKGVECAYSGGVTFCDRSLDNCRILSNSARFGGRPGIVGAPKFIGR